MNKKHLILPVVACLMLAGCTLGKKTSKKRKKSSSVAEISQSVEPGPGASSQTPGASSQTPGASSQTPAASSQTPAASSQTPAGSSQTPAGSSQTPPGSSTTPVTDNWSSSEIANFNTAFHNIVPPYASIGLDSTQTSVEEGFFCTKAWTESASETYYNGLDSTWVIAYDAEGYEEKHKTSSDGQGYVICYIGLDDDSNYVIVWQWYSPVASIAFSGSYPTTFNVGDTFSHDGIVVSATCKDGYVYEDVTDYVTFSEPDMSTPGQKVVTVTLEDEDTITNTYIINVESSVKYTVSFNAGEGSGTMAPVQASEGTYILPDCTFTAPSGKAFAGWKANDAGDLIPAGGSYNLTGETTFYAYYTSSYTITFNAGGGTGTMNPVSVGEGSTYILPDCTFTAPSGKEFDGWTVDGSTKVTQLQNVTSNVTVTALWKDKPASQTVTYTIDNPVDTYGKKFSDLTDAEVLSGFVSDGEAVITGFKDNNGYVYFGGNGGSGATAFTFVDAFKLGKSSAKGQITLTIGSGHAFSKLVLTLCGQRDDGSITVNGVEKSVTAKITGTGALTPSTVTTETVEFDITSGTTDFVMSSKDATSGNYSIYIVGIQFVA